MNDLLSIAGWSILAYVVVPFGPIFLLAVLSGDARRNRQRRRAAWQREALERRLTRMERLYGSNDAHLR